MRNLPRAFFYFFRVSNFRCWFFQVRFFFRNLAWRRILELIFGEKFTARRAESEFDTFGPTFLKKYDFSASRAEILMFFMKKLVFLAKIVFARKTNVFYRNCPKNHAKKYSCPQLGLIASSGADFWWKIHSATRWVRIWYFWAVFWTSSFFASAVFWARLRNKSRENEKKQRRKLQSEFCL